MKIEVTQEDIDGGCRESAGHCPIALALARATGCPVSVGPGSCSVRKDDGWHHYELPLAARRFVRDFDGNTAPVSPFKFTLGS